MDASRNALAWMTLAIALIGCAAEVVRRPVDLSDYAAQASRVHVATAAVAFKLDSGYPRQIAAGTEFADFGAIPQGRVLRPANATLTVEGAHMHEAYAVVHDGRLVGFYLPVERSFSPLSQPVPLSLHERKP